MLRRGGSCFRVEHLLLCGIPNLETIKQKQVNSASKPSNQQTSGTKSSSIYHSRCFGIRGGHGKSAFKLAVKLSVESGYVFLSLRL
jgi:hypothetical protein